MISILVFTSFIFETVASQNAQICQTSILNEIYIT